LSAIDIDATQEEFRRRMDAIQWCRTFPAQDAVRILAAQRIDVSEFGFLADCLAWVSRSWDFKLSQERVDGETQIAHLARELVDLLARAEHDNGWRHVWSEPHDDEELELEAVPEESVEIDQLIDSLETVAKSADDRLWQLSAARAIGTNPPSEAKRACYFYWMTLFAFWKYVLLRKVGTSTRNKDNTPSGPLISFLMTMSVGMPGRGTPGAVQAFVKDHRGKVDKFARSHLYPLPLRVKLDLLASHGQLAPKKS
jgi:hypothetical protein